MKLRGHAKQDAAVSFIQEMGPCTYIYIYIYIYIYMNVFPFDHITAYHMRYTWS